MICPICSNDTFRQVNVLKDRLITEWELNKYEENYINRQQGFMCDGCNSSLRIMTLAQSILLHYKYQGNFIRFCKSFAAKRLKVLEINSAGRLHHYLPKMKNYTFAEYPDVDMQKMPYDDEEFDLVIHSDTLEHVKNSLTALKDCKRILKPDGILCYTIPIIYGRKTRRRDNLSNSFHGSQEESQGIDYKVFTEYGSDFWIEIIKAGFNSIRLYTLKDLDSVSIIAQKHLEPSKDQTYLKLKSIRSFFSRIKTKIVKKTIKPLKKLY